jgi:hypothetical protein
MDDEAMTAAVMAVTVAMAKAFDEVWAKPNAAQVMENFLS